MKLFHRTREMLVERQMGYFPTDIPTHQFRWSPDLHAEAIAAMERYGARQPVTDDTPPQLWGYPVVVDETLPPNSVLLEPREGR